MIRLTLFGYDTDRYTFVAPSAITQVRDNTSDGSRGAMITLREGGDPHVAVKETAQEVAILKAIWSNPEGHFGREEVRHMGAPVYAYFAEGRPNLMCADTGLNG